MNQFNEFGNVNKPDHCLWCGRKLRKYKFPQHFAGKQTLGDYGDGFFCGLRCGYKFAVRNAQLGRRLAPVTARHVNDKEPIP